MDHSHLSSEGSLTVEDISVSVSHIVSANSSESRVEIIPLNSSATELASFGGGFAFLEITSTYLEENHSNNMDFQSCTHSH